MTTAQCSSLMRLFVFVALAFGFVGFLGSGGAISGTSSTFEPGAHYSMK